MIKPYCHTCRRILWNNSTGYNECLSEHDITYEIIHASEAMIKLEDIEA